MCTPWRAGVYGATPLDTADAFPEADVPHKTENLPLFGGEATLCSKGNLLQPDIHAGAIQKHLNEENPGVYDVANVHNEPKGFPCRSVEILKKEIRVARYQDLSISRIGSPLPENIEIDLRRARTLEQHLASVKQKVAENTAHDEWHRINELQHRMDVVDNILKEISENVKFVNKEMMDIESESFLINSKIETPRCMNTKEKEPPSDFQTQAKLPPIPIRAKQTPKIPTMNHLSDHTTKFYTSSSQIVKSSCLPRQMETKALPAIFPQKGKFDPVVRSAPMSTQRRPQTDIDNESSSLPRQMKTKALPAIAPQKGKFDPVVRSPHMSAQRRPQTDIDNEYKQLQRAMDRVGRNLGPTPLKEHIRYREHETGRPSRRPRNEQDKIPCRGKSKETKSETGFKEKPNQRKRNRNRQKKKKIEKAPIKIEDRPPFSAEVKPSKYFSDMSRLSDAS